MSLDTIRKEIEKIDKEMVELFEKRFHLVEEVIQYKIENNKEINDSQRENYLLEKNKANLKNKKLEKYYEDFLKNLFKISKQYQKDILKNRRK